MRGEHASQVVEISPDVGIIPACAGSTSCRHSPNRRTGGSSPHARGARSASSRAQRSRWDHPRMRGEHPVHVGIIARVLGIIPACAGSTKEVSSEMKLVSGSSPHARGAPILRTLSAARIGDHPRMRGEHRHVPLGKLAGLGIIPACAGSTVVLGHGWVDVDGIIPACAGSTNWPDFIASTA